MGILELQNLTYSYDKKRKVLRGINAQMEAGKMYAILGPSGCGKTTFYPCWAVWTAPQAGISCLKGKTLHRPDWQAIGKRMFLLSFRATT